MFSFSSFPDFKVRSFIFREPGLLIASNKSYDNFIKKLPEERTNPDNSSNCIDNSVVSGFPPVRKEGNAVVKQSSQTVKYFFSGLAE